MAERKAFGMTEHDIERALPVFDVHAYVEDFSASIVPAYRTGAADRAQPADAGLGRSIIPPGTSATRDFSALAPQIPQLHRRGVRGLHGVRQRLSRHGDPRHGPAHGHLAAALESAAPTQTEPEEHGA